eukprot:COSAG04_NODE_27733_length_280_cov_0.856354_1_plen_58_part_01
MVVVGAVIAASVVWYEYLRPEPDPCRDVRCGLHGSCSSGSCVCRDGYTGSRCETNPCL